MPSIIETLLALNNGNLPPIPAPAPPMPIPGTFNPALTTAGQPLPTITPAYGASPDVMSSDVAPGAPLPPLDRNLIAQYLAQALPQPTAPAPLSRGQRIANALVGFGAGIQGRGPEFLQQLQEPQRAYEQQQQAYNLNKQQLGLAGLNAAERKQERQQEMQTRAAIAKSDRDFEIYKMNVAGNDKFAMQQLDQMHEMAKLQMVERMRLDYEDRKAKEAQEQKARDFAAQYGKQAPNPKVALEVGRFYAGLIPYEKLSPEAAGFQAMIYKREQASAEKLARAGRTPAPTEKMAILEDGTTVPASAVDKSKGAAVINGQRKKVVGYEGGKIPKTAGQKAPQGKLSDPAGVR